MAACALRHYWSDDGDVTTFRDFGSGFLHLHIQLGEDTHHLHSSLDEWQDKMLSQMLSLLHHVSPPLPQTALRLMVLKMRAHHMLGEALASEELAWRLSHCTRCCVFTLFMTRLAAVKKKSE